MSIIWGGPRTTNLWQPWWGLLSGLKAKAQGLGSRSIGPAQGLGSRSRDQAQGLDLRSYDLRSYHGEERGGEGKLG